MASPITEVAQISLRASIARKTGTPMRQTEGNTQGADGGHQDGRRLRSTRPANAFA
jgi:hypothetical protein